MSERTSYEPGVPSWVDGEVTPIERVAQTFGQEPPNATE